MLQLVKISFTFGRGIKHHNLQPVDRIMVRQSGGLTRLEPGVSCLRSSIQFITQIYASWRSLCLWSKQHGKYADLYPTAAVKKPILTWEGEGILAYG